MSSAIWPGFLGRAASAFGLVTQAAQLHDFFTTTRLLLGKIIDATAIAGAYKVFVEGMHNPLVAYQLSHTSLTTFGCRELSSLIPGTDVLVASHPQLRYGIILGVFPGTQLKNDANTHQVISQTTRQRVDEAHKVPLQLNKNGGIADKLAGRPIDGAMSGEWGTITETGMRCFVDSFMGLFGLDEFTGLQVFFHDQLCRLGGYNLQIRSGIYELDALDDQEESHWYEGWAMYPWEQLGYFDRKEPCDTKEAQEWQVSKPWLGKWEPKDDHQQPFHRLQQFRGYLGQGGKRLLIGKPKTGDSFAYSGGKSDPKNTKFPALFSETLLADGRLLVETAKGLSLVKRCGIIPATRLVRCEQTKDGDSDEKYKASGKEGGGPEHKITGDLETTGDDAAMQRVNGILDMHAYMFNYAGVHPFFWHEKDWKIPQEKELELNKGTSIKQIQFAELDEATFLQQPDPVTFEIDHRLKDQKYFQNECGLTLLDDGGVVLYDGYGGEIRMSAGSIWISAPGDVWLKAGRNVIQWGGGDVILSGHKNVEINASNEDVRIKAEKNMQVTAGNAQTGGILLESKAAGPNFNFEQAGTDVMSSGIVLKAAHSPVALLGGQLYLATGRGDGEGAVDEGPIYIDAAKGKQAVTIAAQMLSTYVKQGVAHYYGDDMANPEHADFFSPGTTIFSGVLGVAKMAIINGPILANGSVLVAGGHIVTEFAPQASYYVSPLEGEGLQSVKESCSNIDQEANNKLPMQGGELYSELLDALYYADQKIGNDDLVTSLEFTWRTVDQMRTSDWKLFEDRWQQLAKLWGGDGTTWTENVVKTQAESEMYPYPGKDNWEGDKFYQQEPKLFDQAGYSKDRGTAPSLASDYETPKYGEAKPASLKSKYVVTRS